jgi:hypothetical protein
VLANHSHGLKSIHSRHEDVQEHQIEIAGLAQFQTLSSIVDGDYAMSGSLKEQADGHLDRRVVIHNQYPCQSKKFSAPCRIKSTVSCELRRIAVLPQHLLGGNAADAASRE